MKHLYTHLTSLFTVRYSLFTLLLLLAGSSMAQSSMVVTKTDGTQISIRVAEIQDVTFPSDNRVKVEVPYESFWLKPEQWIQLEAYCYTPEGDPLQSAITWKSTNEQVATVDEDGVVIGVGDGTCQILATTDGGQAQLTINVTSRTMLNIELEDIQNRQCTYSVTPADSTLRYYYLLRIQSGEYSVDRMDQYGSEEQNCYHFALDWWDFCASLYGMSWVDFMNEVGLSSGKTTETEGELKPGEQYCIFAFAMHEDGTLASPVEITKFMTTLPEASDNTFEVTVDTITSAEVIFTIVPSNNDKYFVNVQRASYVEWFINNNCVREEMVPSLTNTITPSLYPEAYCQGTVTRSTSDFLESIRKDTDYYVIVFGYDDGLTTDVSLTKFHTLP